MQIRLPSASAIENEVVCPGSARSLRHPLLGGASDRLAVAHALPQPRDHRVGQGAGCLIQSQIAVCDPLAGCKTDRAIDRVEMIRAVLRQAPKVVTFKNFEGQSQLETAALRRRDVKLEPSIRHGQGIEPMRLDGSEIGQCQAAAERTEIVYDPPAEVLAAIQMLRPQFGDLRKRPREFRLRDDAAELHRYAVRQVVLDQRAV